MSFLRWPYLLLALIALAPPSAALGVARADDFRLAELVAGWEQGQRKLEREDAEIARHRRSAENLAREIAKLKSAKAQESAIGRIQLERLLAEHQKQSGQIEERARKSQNERLELSQLGEHIAGMYSERLEVASERLLTLSKTDLNKAGQHAAVQREIEDLSRARSRFTAVDSIALAPVTQFQTNDPEELRARADEIADNETALRNQAESIRTRIREMKRMTRLLEHAQELSREDSLFDEMNRGRITKTQRASISSSRDSEKAGASGSSGKLSGDGNEAAASTADFAPSSAKAAEPTRDDMSPGQDPAAMQNGEAASSGAVPDSEADAAESFSAGGALAGNPLAPPVAVGEVQQGSVGGTDSTGGASEVSGASGLDIKGVESVIGNRTSSQDLRTGGPRAELSELERKLAELERKANLYRRQSLDLRGRADTLEKSP